MSSRIEYEIWLSILSLATGAWLMMAYDTLRVLRLVIRHSSFWVGIEDFAYWIYAGLATFILLYEQNDGTFRMYVIIGVFAGMILYDRLISRFFFKCLKKAGKCFKIITRRWNQNSDCNSGSEKIGEQ